jgi:hypothetical protein
MACDRPDKPLCPQKTRKRCVKLHFCGKIKIIVDELEIIKAFVNKQRKAGQQMPRNFSNFSSFPQFLQFPQTPQFSKIILAVSYLRR